ncbi:MAG: hypothetical protein ACOYIO_03010 [Eubacteriales bacterium]|jgi:hypothetical protein
MKHSTGGTELEVDEENLCESTRLALADEKPLNRAQEAHLKTCEFCRRFQNETEILKKDLAALDIDPLIKNGVSLADAVMEEVEKQAAFRIKSSASPKHRLFRHAGLAAACLVVFVLAAPTVFNTICAQKKFDTLPNEAALPQTMFSAGNADKAADDKVSSELAASDENAYLTDKGANDKAFSDAADTVFSDESTEEETKVPLLTVQFAGTNDISEKQNSSDSQSGGTNAAVSSSSDNRTTESTNNNLTTESTNNVSGPFLMLKPSSENATSAVGGDTTNEYVSDRYSAENSAENSTNNDNSTANGVDGVLPPNNQITAKNSAADTASEEVPDPSSALTGSGGGGGEKKFSPSSVHAPETDDTSNSFDTGESDNLDDRSTVSALSLVETAYEAAVARFGTRYAISTDKASVTTLSENRLYVDFSVEATAVHLQVFMTFTDGEWRISSDADGNVQIFEVTELYNYVG